LDRHNSRRGPDNLLTCKDCEEPLEVGRNWSDKMKQKSMYRCLPCQRLSRRVYKSNHYEHVLSLKRAYHHRLRPVTYRFMLPDGTLAYVGSGLPTRISAHKKRAKWYTPDMTVVFKPRESTAHARKLEWEWFIRYGPPLYNQDGKQRMPKENGNC